MTDCITEIKDLTKSFFTKHQFKTYGDAMGWILNATYENREKAAGDMGYSKFSTDILWLTARFGPKYPVSPILLNYKTPKKPKNTPKKKKKKNN